MISIARALLILQSRYIALDCIRRPIKIAETARQVTPRTARQVSVPEELCWGLFDTIFAPKIVVRQLMLVSALQATITTTRSLREACRTLASRWLPWGWQKRTLAERLADARSYAEWRSAAQKLDALEGHEAWRSVDETPLYNYREIAERTALLERNARVGGDDTAPADDAVFSLMYRLRGSAPRGPSGIMHDGLYTRARCGTKRMVERYFLPTRTRTHAHARARTFSFARRRVISRPRESQRP